MVADIFETPFMTFYQLYLKRLLAQLGLELLPSSRKYLKLRLNRAT
jgi:hypothetical protein